MIQPPSVGPIEGAKIAVTPYKEKASPRRRGGKVSARMACAIGCRPPPPPPWITRAISKTPRLGAMPQSERADGEDDDAGHEEPLAPEDAYQPAADGQNDGIRNQVGGEHPGALILAGAEVSGDMGQGYIGNAGVEHFHECRQRNHKGNQPGVCLRLPVVVCLSECAGGGAHSHPLLRVASAIAILAFIT